MLENVKQKILNLPTQTTTLLQSNNQQSASIALAKPKPKVLLFLTLLAMTSVILFGLLVLPGQASERSNGVSIADTSESFANMADDTTDFAPANSPQTIAYRTVNTTELPIPPILAGEMVDGVRVYQLTMMTGTTEFTPGIQTETRGYNGTYLGPTMVMTYGEVISAHFKNELGVHTTNHWHGLHLPAIMDGGPHQDIEPDTTWYPTFTFLNRASLYWYHPHPHGDGASDPDATGGQVYSGLAGLIISRDDDAAQVNLPRTYGVDEIPLVIQDRDFDEDGQLTYSGFFRKGSTFLVNGGVSPTLNTHAQVIRFRILNASNVRIHNFGFSDNRTFTQIGTDGGLLPAPAEMTRIVLSPAERADILVDFTGETGTSLTFMAYNSEILDVYQPSGNGDTYDNTDFDIFGITVGEQTTDSTPVTTIPDTLASFHTLTEADADNLDSPRPFVLENGIEINGALMDMDLINEFISVNTVEIWEVSNTTTVAHPLHIHDDQFQILDRNGVAPAAGELGWKDTVLVAPDEVVRIIKPFEDFADSVLPYMYHCHLLEHEDSGMMGQFATTVDGFFSADSSGTSTAGSTINYTHIITNFASNITDTFTIGTSSSQSWSTATTPASFITLGPSEVGIITVSVTISDDATTDTVDDTTTTVTSVNNPNVSELVVDTTTVTDTVAPAEISVIDIDNGVAIADGTGSVDFGTTFLGVPITKTFIISNVGEVSLAITEVTNIPPGFSAVDFVSTTVLSNSTTTFSIQLTADTTGIFNGTFSFSNSDATENPYNFTINGTVIEEGTNFNLPAEMHVFDGTIEIPDNTGEVDFGRTSVGTHITRTFTISNVGEIPLVITAPLMLPPGFTSTTFVDTTVISPNSSTTFDVQLAASAPGPVGGPLAIINSDRNENPYDFIIRGDVRNPADEVELPIPPLLYGEMVDGVRVYNVAATNGITEFLPGLNTNTKGYNGNFLGPTLVMTRGESVSAHITNNLPENTTFYWHGLHVPAIMNGGPHQVIAPDTTWVSTFTFLNRPSLYWYHPLIHPGDGARNPNGTGGQVYSGLAGLILVRNNQNTQFRLPQTYGVDEIPLIIQDRAFDAVGQFRVRQGPGPFHRKGDRILVNGVIDPTLYTYGQVIRFRILNGSNARVYNFGFQNDHPFYLIGTDGGLLDLPIELTRLPMAPGERADILVDFGPDRDRRVHFRAYNSELTSVLPPQDADPHDTTDYDIFGINVGNPIPEGITQIPPALTPITQLDENDAVNANTPRRFELQDGGLINGTPADLDFINERLTLNTIEVWEVTNTSRFAQPLHIGDGQFQVLTRDGNPPFLNERGWKDTILIKPRDVVRIIRSFEDFADPGLPYVYHSNLLEDKDNGMMGQFTIATDGYFSSNGVGSGARGSVVDYTHTLTNFSVNLTDTFVLATTSNQLWQVSTTPASPITLGPGQSQVITVSITVRDTAQPGVVDSTRVTARSSNNPNEFDAVVNATTALAGAVLTSEIDLLESNVSIPDNTGSVDFGTTTVGTPVIKTFTIQNSGTGDLTVSNLNLPPGFTSPDFANITTIPANGSATFNVHLTAGNVGPFNGTLSFSNNDSNENPYDITISGVVIAVGAPIPQEIDVLDGTTSIPDNSGTVDFGSTPLGTAITKTFTVANTGELDLVLTEPISLPLGFTSAGFASTTVISNSTTTFEVQLTATVTGTFSGALSFANNDSNENPYNFTISGTVTDVAAPETFFVYLPIIVKN